MTRRGSQSPQRGTAFLKPGEPAALRKQQSSPGNICVQASCLWGRPSSSLTPQTTTVTVPVPKQGPRLRFLCPTESPRFPVVIEFPSSLRHSGRTASPLGPALQPACPSCPPFLASLVTPGQGGSWEESMVKAEGSQELTQRHRTAGEQSKTSQAHSSVLGLPGRPPSAEPHLSQ